MPEKWRRRFETSASVTCVIDVDSVITYCNPAWDAFALRNGGACATSRKVLGSSLYDYVPGVLQPHYRKIIEASRLNLRGGGTDYECNTPGSFRIYHMAVLPIPNTDLLAMVHSLRIERSPTFEPQRVSAYHRGPGNVVTMCAQCRRSKNNQNCVWNWVPEFVRTPPQRVSHGICPDCTMYLYA